MKIDLYTKGILTVIALSLVVMAFKDVSPVNKAFAQNNNQVIKMALCNPDGERCVAIYTNHNNRGQLSIYNNGN